MAWGSGGWGAGGWGVNDGISVIERTTIVGLADSSTPGGISVIERASTLDLSISDTLGGIGTIERAGAVDITSAALSGSGISIFTIERTSARALGWATRTGEWVPVNDTQTGIWVPVVGA